MMSQQVRLLVAALMITVAAALALSPRPGFAASAAEIDRDTDAALVDLYANSSEAKALSEQSKGILVFPRIIKGGLIIGAQGGEGALRVNDQTSGYYNTVGVSYGLQAGVQWFGYAMFFMNDEALQYLDESDGWEIGAGPSIVVVDKGAASSLTTTSAKDDIYVFFFEQEGLMAGLGLQGTKITKFTPEE